MSTRSPPSTRPGGPRLRMCGESSVVTKARRRCTNIGDGVDEPVRVEGRHMRGQLVQGNRKGHAEVERSIAVKADPPSGRLQAPVRIHVHRHEAVLGETDPFDYRGCARARRPSERQRCPSLISPATIVTSVPPPRPRPRLSIRPCRSLHVGQHRERGLVFAEQMVLAPFRIELGQAACRIASAPSPCAARVGARGRRTLRSLSGRSGAEVTAAPAGRVSVMNPGRSHSPRSRPLPCLQASRRGDGWVGQPHAGGDQIGARRDDVRSLRRQARPHLGQLVLRQPGPGLAAAVARGM